MSDNAKPMKGFRQAKKPTKGQLEEENAMLGQQLQASVQFLTQQMMQTMMQLQRMQAEQRALADLQRCYLVPDDTPAEKGDYVMLDFLGRFDTENGDAGEMFENGFGLGYTLELGSNSLVGDFEDQLVGLKGGDVKDIKVVFPEDYQAEELAGKPVTFNVKVINVWKKSDPHNVIFNLYKTLQEKKEQEAAKESKTENKE